MSIVRYLHKLLNDREDIVMSFIDQHQFLKVFTSKFENDKVIKSAWD